MYCEILVSAYRTQIRKRSNAGDASTHWSILQLSRHRDKELQSPNMLNISNYLRIISRKRFYMDS